LHNHKNWLFVGGETTGQRAAIIYTMVECAKRHGHDPEVWLTDVLERLPAMTNQDDLTVLLPSNWQLAEATTETATAPRLSLKLEPSSKAYIPLYAIYAPTATNSPCPSVERLLFFDMVLVG
jgi:hypothetical protein